MSDENRPPVVGQWGRPLRKRSRGPQAQPAASDAPAVGPVDDPARLDRAAAIVHTGPAPGSEPGAVAPPPRPRREAQEPQAEDFRLRDLVAYVAKGLVDHPDDVRVEILEPGDDASFELHVHPDDLGHVIGKQGRTARSMRLALGAAAARSGRRANLEIAD
ncbi:MAG: KH domain-containing protein [Candidatus Eisenbacteria bacterium]|nr:KH domain-containing protein [Candidatus Eisenbacteria bacterium]